MSDLLPTAPATALSEHCKDRDAWLEFHRQYSGQPRSMPQLTDFELANAVFLVDRFSLQLILYQTAAKERIRWLSLRLASALDQIAAAEDLIADLADHEGAEGFSVSTHEALDAYGVKYPSPQSPAAVR